jgi:hypothetical protein
MSTNIKLTILSVRTSKGSFSKMSRAFNYYPRAIYQFLNDLAFKNELSIKEVETMLLRKQIEALGFNCQHTNIGYSKETAEPFCKDCWTRMIEVKQATYNSRQEMITPAKVIVKETFLDSDLKGFAKNEDSTKEEVRN